MVISRTVALVAGATGIIGRGLVEHLSSGNDWEVIGLTRTAPDYDSGARSVPVDLLDPVDCKAKLGSLGGLTHVFFAAYVERPRGLLLLRRPVRPPVLGGMPTWLRGRLVPRLGPAQRPQRPD